MTLRAILVPLLIGTWSLVVGSTLLAATEGAPQAAAAEASVTDAAATKQNPRELDSSAQADSAYPPSTMQMVGALGGALVGILLAIAGVTVTFRSMRKEMRRGRGHSRRPDRGTLPQT